MEAHPNPEHAPKAEAAAAAQSGSAGPFGGATRKPQATASAALPAVRPGTSRELGASFHLRAPDAAHSLEEMAQRDLDAALQLLAERAQYITGANGAAIALRCEGNRDMLCRASAGGNVPEMGTLLSSELGLSGESVRARRALRCDDTQLDPRVNREVCRELGIASVVVMPVVHDDEVLGVFELFSGKVNAFGERDLSALRRLSQMVETAVNLARISATLQERFRERPRTAQTADDRNSADVVSRDVLAGFDPVASDPKVVSDPKLVSDPRKERLAAIAAGQTEALELDRIAMEVASDSAEKPVLWSAATGEQREPIALVDPKETEIPAALRNLSKCAACGFPVSPGRELCVECEEKKWRGQLKSTFSQTQAAFYDSTAAGGQTGSRTTQSSESAAIKPAAVKPASPGWVREPHDVGGNVTRTGGAGVQRSADDVILSAALEPESSWFSRNKYILGAIVAIAATVYAVLMLR